jgi:hypothetical protein
MGYTLKHFLSTHNTAGFQIFIVTGYINQYVMDQNEDKGKAACVLQTNMSNNSGNSRQGLANFLKYTYKTYP